MVQKEIIQIFRNKALLPVIFIMPVIQLVVLGNAATYEIKNINLYVIDADGSQVSNQLVGKFQASPYFNIVNTNPSVAMAETALEEDAADLILQIPGNFEHDLMHLGKAPLFLNINAINGSKAGVVLNYANTIVLSYNNELRRDFGGMPTITMPGQLDIEYSNWFNPDLNFKTFMVPGILVMLVTMIGLFLTGMNIVREKEVGTIEQLNVTPLRKFEFVIGKMVPFWLIGLFALGLGLGVGLIVFKVPMVGSPALVFLFATVYLLVVMGMGLLISTMTDTQQQAVFIAWFFMVIFIMMSGLFTPIESMPVWAQKLTLVNPIAYFVKVIRMVMLKGSGFGDIKGYIGILAGFAIAINSLAIWNYRKTT